jgi:GAF domain-containing protein
MTDMPETDLPPSGLTPVEAEARAEDLQESLADLAAIVTGANTLAELLARVAVSAARAIPRADGAGATLLLDRQGAQRVEALGASHPFVHEIDAIQYELLDEGPCITAALEGAPVVSASLGGDERWPRFGPRVGRLGVHSALSLPLVLPDGTVVGALNAYSRKRDAFDEHAVTLGALFAAPAGVAVRNAQLLEAAQAHAGQLQNAMITRAVIDQAIGILRSRTGGTTQEAFDRLRAISQGENVKLSAVAERVVNEAVRRARVRRSTGGPDQVQ